jgi:hypothetical protein
MTAMLGEVLLMLWLIAKGVDVKGWEEQAGLSGRA